MHSPNLPIFHYSRYFGRVLMGSFSSPPLPLTCASGFPGSSCVLNTEKGRRRSIITASTRLLTIIFSIKSLTHNKPICANCTDLYCWLWLGSKEGVFGALPSIEIKQRGKFHLFLFLPTGMHVQRRGARPVERSGTSSHHLSPLHGKEISSARSLNIAQCI